MTKLTVESHCLDDDFKMTIKKDYNVNVIDESNAPWSVVFEGSKENLIRMYNEHWVCCFDDEMIIDETSNWFHE